MHSVRLLLDTTEYDKQIIEKRFRAITHIHNVLVKKAKKSLVRLRHNKEYQDALKEYRIISKHERELKKQGMLPNESDAERKAKLSEILKEIQTKLYLTDAAMQSYIKVCGKQFSKCLSSQQIQKEASRVWSGVSKVLFSTGKDIHFKKKDSFTTISGKSNTNGVKFDVNALSISWLGLNIKCKLPKKINSAEYILNSLSLGDISYCEIKRMMFPNGWHYYAVVYIKSPAPCKAKDVNFSVSGLDLGTSAIAVVSDNTAVLKELAPKAKEYNKKINDLLCRMDLSRRASNQEYYNPDGTIKKLPKENGKKVKRRWKYSKTYLKNYNKLRSLYRQKSAYIKNSHERMCNELIKDSVHYITEKMNFKALQKRSKRTERSEKVTTNTKKDGSLQTIHKYKRKKRFGKSLNDRSPSFFLTILKRKCMQYEGEVLEVNTSKFKASQYNHVTDTYTKSSLNERNKKIGEHTIQRDLYSAFLLKNSNSELTAPDRSKCLKNFDSFVAMHNALINTMKANKISMKQCFGF